jgi:hypothetical protein
MTTTTITTTMYYFIRPVGPSRTKWFNQILEKINKGRKSWQEIEREELWG